MSEHLKLKNNTNTLLCDRFRFHVGRKHTHTALEHLISVPHLTILQKRPESREQSLAVSEYRHGILQSTRSTKVTKIPLAVVK